MEMKIAQLGGLLCIDSRTGIQWNKLVCGEQYLCNFSVISC